jgi:hypothetical protein
MSSVAAEPSQPLRLRVGMYDPDAVNPYGREVARLLAEHGEHQVRIVVPVDTEWLPASSNVLAVRALPANRRLGTRAVLSRPRQLLRELHGCVRAFFNHVRSDVSVVIWTRSVVDSAFWCVMATVTRRVVVVEHNPGAERPRQGPSVRLRAALFGRAAVVVTHSAALREVSMSAGARRCVRVAPHPPFVGWARDHPSVHSPAGDRTILFLGSLRPDKGGPEGLRAFVAGLAGLVPGVVLEVCGKGRLPQSIVDAARAAAVSVRDSTSDDYVPDAAVADALARAGVLIAPYTAATTSGTVALALSVGLRVAAQSSGELASMLERVGLETCDAASLPKQAMNVLTAARDRRVESLDDGEYAAAIRRWDVESSNAWDDVLTRARG